MFTMIQSSRSIDAMNKPYRTYIHTSTDTCNDTLQCLTSMIPTYIGTCNDTLTLWTCTAYSHLGREMIQPSETCNDTTIWDVQWYNHLITYNDTTIWYVQWYNHLRRAMIQPLMRRAMIQPSETCNDTTIWNSFFKYSKISGLQIRRT